MEMGVPDVCCQQGSRSQKYPGAQAIRTTVRAPNLVPSSLNLDDHGILFVQ